MKGKIISYSLAIKDGLECVQVGLRWLDDDNRESDKIYWWHGKTMTDDGLLANEDTWTQLIKVAKFDGDIEGLQRGISGTLTDKIIDFCGEVKKDEQGDVVEIEKVTRLGINEISKKQYENVIKTIKGAKI